MGLWYLISYPFFLANMVLNARHVPAMMDKLARVKIINPLLGDCLVADLFRQVFFFWLVCNINTFLCMVSNQLRHCNKTRHLYLNMLKFLICSKYIEERSSITSVFLINCHCDICPGNICLGDICPYQEYLSSYWSNFDQTLKVGSLEPCLKDANSYGDICPCNICPGDICPNK